jgi:hypothetical protein
MLKPQHGVHNAHPTGRPARPGAPVRLAPHTTAETGNRRRSCSSRHGRLFILTQLIRQDERYRFTYLLYACKRHRTWRARSAADVRIRHTQHPSHTRQRSPCVLLPDSPPSRAPPCGLAGRPKPRKAVNPSHLPPCAPDPRPAPY